MNDGFLYWIAYIGKEYWGFYLKGTILTLAITVLGTFGGFFVGFLVGLIQATPIENGDSKGKQVLIKALKFICRVYVGVFRGTPMIVQAMVIYYGTLSVLGVDISNFSAAVVVVLLNTGAYMAETVRGGIISIDAGQNEGGAALGMSYFTIMTSVVLPQAFRNIIPQMGNTFITNLKMTSVLNVIAVTELFFVTKTAAGTYYKYFEAFVLCGLIYLVLTYIFTKALDVLEKKMSDSDSYEIAEEYLNCSAEF